MILCARVVEIHVIHIHLWSVSEICETSFFGWDFWTSRTRREDRRGRLGSILGNDNAVVSESAGELRVFVARYDELLRGGKGGRKIFGKLLAFCGRFCSP